MIKVSVLYPGGDGSTFDMDYYLNTRGDTLGKSVSWGYVTIHVTNSKPLRASGLFT